jgi:hypothetical protein
MDSIMIKLLLLMDNNPPHNLIVVLGVVEVTYDPSQVPKGRVYTERYLHLLVTSRESLVGHVVVLIFGGIVHRNMVDGLWRWISVGTSSV